MDQHHGRPPPPGLSLPSPLAALLDWIEAQGYLNPSQRFEGDHFGTLQPLEQPTGTVVLFRVETQPQAAESAAWFGKFPDPETASRLVPFARTGSDGSHAAFWRDDAGEQHIVQLGSEGLICRLAATPLDFLRLCAIGYPELVDALDDPETPPTPSPQTVNAAFVTWLTSTWNVTVPNTAAEIVGPAPGHDDTDPFTAWVRARQL